MTLQYQLTPTGRKLLMEGDYLVHLANQAAQDGVVSAEELMKLHLGLTRVEADYILSVLRRLGLIVECPIQGVKYVERGKYN